MPRRSGAIDERPSASSNSGPSPITSHEKNNQMFFLCVCVAEDPANRTREEKKRFRSRQTASKQGTNHSDSYSRRIDLPRSNAVAREARTFAYVPLGCAQMGNAVKDQCHSERRSVEPRIMWVVAAWVGAQLTICKSQRHFVSAAAAILKEVSLGLNLTQSRCGGTVECQSFGRTATFCKNWEIVGSLSCDIWLSLSIAKMRNKRE